MVGRTGTQRLLRSRADHTQRWSAVRVHNGCFAARPTTHNDGRPYGSNTVEKPADRLKPVTDRLKPVTQERYRVEVCTTSAFPVFIMTAREPGALNGGQEPNPEAVKGSSM